MAEFLARRFAELIVDADPFLTSVEEMVEQTPIW